MKVATPQFNIADFVRKYIPFSQSPVKNGLKSGRGQYLFATFSSANVDTSFAITLGHAPEGYIVERASTPGSVGDGTQHGADWTPAKIVLRASAAGTYRLLVK